MYPSFEGSDRNSKVDAIFVVDRSGSMSGDRIKKTSEALGFLIHGELYLQTVILTSLGSGQLKNGYSLSQYLIINPILKKQII